MKNKEALDFFKKMSQNTNDQKSVKLANASDFSQMDADFILKYCNANTEMLDLGSGTGLVINKMYDKVKTVVAVEPFASFTKFIVNSPNVEVVNQTFDEYSPGDRPFDLITIFGTMHYFNEEESVKIYSKYFRNLKKGGRLIVKNQFGVTEDVTVEGYSEEQKTNYFAQYRHLDKEMANLRRIGFCKTESFDIYPPECNRWTNTHFYAIVAEK